MKKIFRIKKHEKFLQIKQEGMCLRSETLTLHYQKNSLTHSRVGIQVTKKCGNAVKRNRIKRQIRAILGKGFDFSKQIDLIITARPSFRTDSFTKEQEELIKLLKQLEIQSEEKH